MQTNNNMETQHITKLEKAKVIIAINDFRETQIEAFNGLMANTPVLRTFMQAQGSGELKLLIEKIKDDLLGLEPKLESLL